MKWGYLRRLRWYHVTRTVGTVTVLYELFFATGSPERGTIILAGFVAGGFDYVARSSLPKDST